MIYIDLKNKLLIRTLVILICLIFIFENIGFCLPYSLYNKTNLRVPLGYNNERFRGAHDAIIRGKSDKIVTGLPVSLTPSQLNAKKLLSLEARFYGSELSWAASEAEIRILGYIHAALINNQGSDWLRGLRGSPYFGRLLDFTGHRRTTLLDSAATIALGQIYTVLVSNGKPSLSDIEAYSYVPLHFVGLVYTNLFRQGKISLAELEAKKHSLPNDDIRCYAINEALGFAYADLVSQGKMSLAELRTKNNPYELVLACADLFKQDKMSLAKLEKKLASLYGRTEPTVANQVLGSIYADLVSQGKMSLSEVEAHSQTKKEKGDSDMEILAEGGRINTLGYTYTDLFNRSRLSLADLEARLSNSSRVIKQAAANALSPVYADVFNRIPILPEDWEKCTLLKRSKLLFDEEVMDRYLGSDDPQAFIDSFTSVFKHSKEGIRWSLPNVEKRFSAKLVETIGNNRLENKVDNRPLAVVIYPTDDSNGAFSKEDNSELIIGKLAKEGFRVMYYEVGKVKQWVSALEEATQYQKARAIFIGGHGSYDTVQLGGDEAISLEDEKYLRNSGITEALEEKGTAVLISCSTGAGLKDRDNIANMFSRLFPQAEAVFAPSTSTNFGKFIVSMRHDDNTPLISYVGYSHGTYVYDSIGGTSLLQKASPTYLELVTILKDYRNHPLDAANINNGNYLAKHSLIRDRINEIDRLVNQALESIEKVGIFPGQGVHDWWWLYYIPRKDRRALLLLSVTMPELYRSILDSQKSVYDYYTPGRDKSAVERALRLSNWSALAEQRSKVSFSLKVRRALFHRLRNRPAIRKLLSLKIFDKEHDKVRLGFQREVDFMAQLGIVPPNGQRYFIKDSDRLPNLSQKLSPVSLSLETSI